jgi:hypothetical protein
MRFLSRTPVRTFIVYPIVTLLWELITRGDRLIVNPWFLPLMIWGYLQYRLCGRYRLRIGGGGPGLERPPAELVSTGPYAYTRNPMYHFSHRPDVQLSIVARRSDHDRGGSLVSHRVLKDEKKLIQVLGPPYENYLARVKRWIPGLF